MSDTTWNLEVVTQRLILRPQQPSDYEAWYAGFAGRLPSQHKYDEGQVDLSECDFQWFCNLCQHHQKRALQDKDYIFGVFLRETNRHLGNVDLSTIRREENQWANLGYGIHNQYQRQGFGTEAVRAAIIAGFEHLNYHRIEAAINLDNDRSIALAKRVGMKKECMRSGFFYENEQWVDHLIYVALPADFELAEKPPVDVIESLSQRIASRE
ncbi:GNAT family N-acetyltransferase [Aliterella atlantica]|uniref:GNAT family N-acetyltransferase n=1 Tax=Aliterella atlantica TaxID=1827278 RepID=UPI000908187D|nr:GNAT family protein [Aliterella atlantica]